MAAFLHQAPNVLSEMIFSKQNCNIQGAGCVLHNLQNSQRDAAHIRHDQSLDCYVSITLRACGILFTFQCSMLFAQTVPLFWETFILPSNLFALKSDNKFIILENFVEIYQTHFYWMYSYLMFAWSPKKIKIYFSMYSLWICLDGKFR